VIYGKSRVYTTVIHIDLDLYGYQRIPEVKDLVLALRQHEPYACVDQDDCYWRQEFLIYNAGSTRLEYSSRI